MKAGPTRSDLSCPLSDEVRLCSLVLCTLHTLSNMTAVIVICDYNVYWILVKVTLYLVNPLCMIHCFNGHNYAIDSIAGLERLARFVSPLDDVALFLY